MVCDFWGVLWQGASVGGSQGWDHRGLQVVLTFRSRCAGLDQRLQGSAGCCCSLLHHTAASCTPFTINRHPSIAVQGIGRYLLVASTCMAGTTASPADTRGFNTYSTNANTAAGHRHICQFVCHPDSYGDLQPDRAHTGRSRIQGYYNAAGVCVCCVCGGLRV